MRRDAERLRSIAGAEAGANYDSLVRTVRATLRGHTLWQINATAEGGGVAELLRSCLGYLSDDGIATRWLVIDADPAFFEITKRIHNRLHGDLGDGGPLGPAERSHYDDVTGANLRAVLTLVAPGDVVVIHDPQPLGLVPGLVAAGATVVWTCHVGIDMPNAITRSAWDFLRDDVLAAHAATFTRAAYAWHGLEADRVHVIPPVHRRRIPQERRARPRACGVDRSLGGPAGPSSGGCGLLPPGRRFPRHDRGAGRDHRDAPAAPRGSARGAGVAVGRAEGPDRRDARVCGRPVTRRSAPDTGGTQAGIGGRRSRGGRGARRGPRRLEALADEGSEQGPHRQPADRRCRGQRDHRATLSNAAPTSWCRRASPRGSGSP